MTKTDNIIGKARYKRARQSKFVVKVKIKDCNNWKKKAYSYSLFCNQYEAEGRAIVAIPSASCFIRELAESVKCVLNAT